jgi:hypothetical protein
MNAFHLIFRIIATAMLIVAFTVIAVFALVMFPFYLLLIAKGKAKAVTISQIIPLGIIAALVWKLWRPEGMSYTERAYYDGVMEGQVKASRVAGRIDGARMIAQVEDLSLKPVYSVRHIRKENGIPY